MTTLKRLFMGLAACTLLMTSCTEQGIMENVDDGQGQLSFSPGLGKQATKAAELTNSSLKGNATSAEAGIALRTYQETTTAGTFEKWFTDNLWYTNSEWKIESTRFRNTAATKYITYFPKTGVTQVTNSFENATFVENTGTFPAFTYTVGTTSDAQTDLIAGITNVGAKKTDIVLGMRHILSQVNFGTVAYSGANIYIQNIKIVGLFNSATFTYGAKDEYPIGAWSVRGTGGTPTDRTATYDYFDYSNTTKTDNLQPAVPYTATSGDKYIFGDGGNWGPGKIATTFYPVGTNGAWEVYNTTTPQVGLGNSLILMPQEFSNVEGAKVTFEYKITDKDGAFVAGTSAFWAKGEFKLDFSTGTTLGKDYMAQWDQNYRYVYLIDFTDFLDGNALKFSVNVDMYPWENYNNDGDDNGEVDIIVAGQPTQTKMNSIENDGTWYIATQTGVVPTDAEWAQVIRDEVWDMSNYDFTKITQGNTFKINFNNVIFNTKDGTPDPVATTLTMTLPDGFIATPTTTNITVEAHATLSNTWVISKGDKSENAAITITNSAYYRTSSALGTAIEAAATNALKLGYGGTEAVDLTTMAPTTLTAGNTITVKFNSPVVPTVSDASHWKWDATTRTATYTAPTAP